MQSFYRIRKPLECGLYNLGDLLMRMNQMRALFKYGMLTRSLNFSLPRFFCPLRAITHKILDAH